MKQFKQYLRSLRKRFGELRYRISNYRYWRAKGLSPGGSSKLAWKKADQTL